MSTPGYTRQRVELAASIPFDSPDGPLGTGVDVTTIARLRDHFADARVRSTSAEFARLDVRAELLDRTEAITGEPDSGISSELNSLWDAFEDLAMNPTDAAVRRQVIGPARHADRPDPLRGRVVGPAGRRHHGAS